MVVWQTRPLSVVTFARATRDVWRSKQGCKFACLLCVLGINLLLAKFRGHGRVIDRQMKSVVKHFSVERICNEGKLVMQSP